MKKILQLSLLAATAFSASQVFAASPSWDFVELDYVKLDVDDTNIKPAGAALSGTALVSDNVFLTGSYLRTSESLPQDNLDYDTLDLGIGYKHSLSDSTDWYATASFVRLDAETRNSSVTENGYGIATGIRSMMTENFELAAEVSYADIDVDDQTTFGIMGTYYVTDQIGINLGYSVSSDVDAINVGVRYVF